MSMLPPLSGRIRNGLASLAASIVQLTATAYRTFYSDAAGNVQVLPHGAAGTVLKSNGAAANPSWGSVTDTAIVGASTWKVLYVNGTNVVVELSLGADGKYLRAGGVAVAPTFAAIAPTELLGTAYRTVYNDSAGLMKELIHGASGTFLKSNGAAADPSWAVIAPTQLVGTAYRTLYENSAGAVTELIHGASGTFLKSNGAAADPSWATPPAAAGGTPAVVLGTAAAAGVAATFLRDDDTIVAFDATAPSTQAFSDAAAVGTATVAARRDHKHAMPANPAAALTAGTADVALDETTTSSIFTNLATSGPAVTLSPGATKDHVIAISATMFCTSTGFAYMSVAVAGAAAVGANGVIVGNSANVYFMGSRTTLATAQANGATHTVKYKVSGAGTADFDGFSVARRLTVHNL